MLAELTELPLRLKTPEEWGVTVLSDPVALLIDHAFLEKKAANNALELMTRWPGDFVPGWVETMASVAKDETLHLAQVVRILTRRGGRLDRAHKNDYANALRRLVRKGEAGDILDRLLISAMIEARSCERFGVLADAAPRSGEAELGAFYQSLFRSELGHYTVFLRLAESAASSEQVDARWNEMLDLEADILASQPRGSRIHSGW